MRREWVYALTIFIGLWVDQNGTQWPIKGEYIVNIVCWLVFANIFAKGERIERIEMLTVIAFATPMELFFSEVWHLYEYREGLMPLFVPAGHWFLFDLGRRLCRRIVPSCWSPRCCHWRSISRGRAKTPRVWFSSPSSSDSFTLDRNPNCTR
jgi:hypothetical protein